MELTLSSKELLCYNQILVNLYENTEYERAFSAFLNDLKQLVDFQKGDIYFYKNNNSHVVFDDFIFVGWSDEHLNRYINDYADIDDVLPITSLNHPVMFRSSDVFLHAERSKTKYYNELLLPADMDYSIEGNIYNGDDGFVAGIGIHRPKKAGDFSQKDLEILKLLRPHLATIASHYLLLRQNMQSYSASLAAMYETSDLGICVIDKLYNVMESNFDAIPTIKSEHSNELLRAVITLTKSIVVDPNTIDSTDTESCPSAQSRICIDHVPYYAEVNLNQLHNGDYNFIAKIHNFNKMFDMMLSNIADRFNLTDRETEVIVLVVKGMSNTEISNRLFISIATVKKHLTNIYTKLGIEGKHQLFSKMID